MATENTVEVRVAKNSAIFLRVLWSGKDLAQDVRGAPQPIAPAVVVAGVRTPKRDNRFLGSIHP